MAARPLQPNLRPWSPWQRRSLALGVVLAGLGVLALLGRSQPTATRVLAGQRGPDYLHTVERLINQADQRIWIMLYVLYGGESEQHPVNHLLSCLAAAQQRGVDVRLVLDIGRVWDSDDIDPKHEQAVALIKRYGLPVITDELERTSHAKVLLIDDEHAVLGSHNWTRSALLRNREAAVWLTDANAVQELEGLFTSIEQFNE